MSKRYVGYYRVSTKQQGQSGLGLEAQQQSVRGYAAEHGELIGEFKEVVSGNSRKHIVLDEALKLAKKHKATLLVKRLDRFSRRVSFISWLLEQGVELEVVEMPNATTFQLHIYAALAEEERRLISERTKAALKIAKERGVMLGTASIERAKENHQIAKDFAETTLRYAEKRYTEGMSYSAIARDLNERGIKSFRNRRFYPQTIKNMIGYIS
jgi:DNA invertase Pin-like site-specific DNA recombinase